MYTFYTDICSNCSHGVAYDFRTTYHVRYMLICIIYLTRVSVKFRYANGFNIFVAFSGGRSASDLAVECRRVVSVN